MAEVKDVKVWKNPTKTECRIYVHTVDGREGCKYLTGNPWHAKGSIDGNLTTEEWAAAKEIAVWPEADGKNHWHTVYENEISSRPRRCPDCGGYDCGSNCNANAPLPPARPATGFDSSYVMMETGRI